MASYYSGPTLTREQTAQVLYQAGIRGEDLTFLVAVAERESGYVSGAHRTDSPRDRLSGDRGLLQINYIWDDDLRAAGIINSPQDLFDPLTNARAAAFVLARQGRAAWGVPGGAWGGASGRAGSLNMSAASAAVARAASQGMLGQDWQSSGGSTASGGDAAPKPPTGLPRDARLVRVDNGRVAAVFRIAGGASIHYFLPSGEFATAGMPVQNMTRDQFRQEFGRSVDGGSTEELGGILPAFGTYQAYATSVFDQLFSRGDRARDDPEVQQLMMEFLGRPDMAEAEFENRLHDTQYWQSLTDGQRRWNDISEAERNVQRRDMASRMRQAFIQYVGTAPPMEHFISGEGRTNVEAIASGQMGFGEWTEQVLKPRARQNPESPWSRQLREEMEAQRQRPMDIENTIARIRTTLSQWGLNWGLPAMRRWATEINTNVRSDDDLLETIKQQAQVLYPWKDPEMETVVAAAPWIETYNRVLERQGSLRTPEIAKALSGYGRDPDNNDPWSFEQRLRLSDARDETREGQDEAWSTVGELAGMMGF